MDLMDTGLTKREYFAAMAMQGLSENLEHEYGGLVDALTTDAVDLADSLIAALNQEAK
jgi:hypothetical protein